MYVGKVCTYLDFYFASAISKDIAQGFVITYKAKFRLNPYTFIENRDGYS